MLTDSSMNMYGYRLLSEGYQMPEYQKNPIGYYMHGTVDHPREQGVLVKWELRADGDKIYGKPSINLSHPRGQRTVDEVENGFLNGASLGSIVALEISSNPDHYLPDQKGPTVSKWFNRECSLVDIPGNFNALTNLVDANDNPINLAAYTNNFYNMKQIFLNPAQLTLLNLKADAEQSAVDTAFADLVAKAGKVEGLETSLAAEKTALANLKAAHADQAVKDIIEKGVGETRFTKEAGELLALPFKGNPEGLKALVATMQPYTPIVNGLKTGSETSGEKKWDEMSEKELQNLKANHNDIYLKKYEERYGSKPNQS